MEFTARQIAELLKGKVEGNSDAKVNRLSKIEEGENGSLSFLSNPKYVQFLYTTKASIVIVNDDFVAEQSYTTTLIRVKNAYESFVHLLEIYNQIQRDKKGIEQPSFSSPSA
jgi:UDP-3-O-[3-hydroxymyristoyl] glucosamine N-acyltransferase